MFVTPGLSYDKRGGCSEKCEDNDRWDVQKKTHPLAASTVNNNGLRGEYDIPYSVIAPTW